MATIGAQVHLRGDLNWQRDAACTGHDPNLFATEMPSGSAARAVREAHERTVQRALAVCRRCPVVAECLADAYETGDRWTVRGGMTGEERVSARRAVLVVAS